MASPAFRNGIPHPSQPSSTPGSRLHSIPLGFRRCGAWVIEVTLIATSVLVPFHLGQYAKSHFAGETVPLNPLLAATEEAIAQTLAIPVGDENRQVAPLTNLLWSGAVVVPLLIAGSQLYLLAKTGKTTPKQWWGVQVTTVTGASPGLARALLREGVGQWGLPLGSAYLIWRYTGAFPDLTILLTLTVVLLIAEGLTTGLNRQRRALHDRLAGTYLLDSLALWQPDARTVWVEPSIYSVAPEVEATYRWANDQDWAEEGAIAAIVLAPEQTSRRSLGLWQWIQSHPGTALLTFSLSTLVLILGTFVGTQIYVQSQTNWRESQQQRDHVFLSLVNKLTISTYADERRAAILSLATIGDPRSTPLLTDLLAQETNPTLIDALHQALVSLGPTTLPYLKKLNQALNIELDSLRDSGAELENDPRQITVALRQQATQQAIAQILTIYSGQLLSVDLSRIDLGQITSPPAPFTLALSQSDLSGLILRGARLTGARLRDVRLCSAGPDGRLGTYDDQIADLSGADLKAADLTNANLSHVLLDRTNLIGAILNKADLTYARLINANLSNASLIDANLQQAVLEHASLTGANLGNANLSQVNLNSALLGEAKAIGANFQSANLIRSDWRGADLSRTNFSRANLQEADLSSTRLENANFQGADLQNANFRDTDLSSADLRGANLEGADFQGVVFVPHRTTPTDGFIQLDPVLRATGLLSGVDFSQVRNLDAEQIQYICFQQGLHSQCP
jgi:uncharacterized protein YjbI with pentapeptide repeats/uncharacterized RDD family membrane protein YckC